MKELGIGVLLLVLIAGATLFMCNKVLPATRDGSIVVTSTIKEGFK